MNSPSNFSRIFLYLYRIPTMWRVLLSGLALAFSGGLFLCFFYYPLHQDQYKLSLKMTQLNDQAESLKKIALLQLKLEQQNESNMAQLKKNYFGAEDKALNIRSVVRILNKDGGVRVRLKPERKKSSKVYEKEIYTMFVSGKFEKVCNLFDRLSKYDQLVRLTSVELKRGKPRNVEGTARLTLIKKVLI